MNRRDPVIRQPATAHREAPAAPISRRDLLTGALTLAALPAIAQAAGSTTGPFTTRHSGLFNGRAVDYVATVGETLVGDADGQPTARFVSIAYVATGVNPAKRPVLFVFNGGPSSASSILHMLALGPRRIVVGQDPRAPATPTSVIDNAFTVLDVADLVFVDPVETGFSRVLPAGKREYFYSVNGDARSVAHFLIAWLKANGREDSPRYVLGESYGTMRAAVMAGELVGTLPLDGVFLLGQAVNMIETSQRAKNALAYATNLPALATIAQYHGLGTRGRGKTPAAVVEEAYAFGMGEYLQALVRGNDLAERDRRRIAGHLEAFTGVGAGYFLSHDLAITKIAFAGELLRTRGQFLSIYDARFVGQVVPAGQDPHDPMMAILGSVRGFLASYLSERLGVTVPMTEYRGAAPDTDNWAWDGTLSPGGPFLDFDYQARLSQAFKANARFRLVIGTGYYDLTTTIGPARYLVTRSDYPRDRVFQRQYVGGHVAYIHEPSLAAFTADLRAWLGGGQPA